MQRAERVHFSPSLFTSEPTPRTGERGVEPQPAMAPSLKQLAWLALPLLTWLLARQILVRPAEWRLRQAQAELSAALDEQLEAEVLNAHEQRSLRHMQAQLDTLVADAERMRSAEAAANAQIVRLDADHERPEHKLGSWKLPGYGRRNQPVSSSAAVES